MFWTSPVRNQWSARKEGPPTWPPVSIHWAGGPRMDETTQTSGHHTTPEYLNWTHTKPRYPWQPRPNFHSCGTEWKWLWGGTNLKKKKLWPAARSRCMLKKHKHHQPRIKQRTSSPLVIRTDTLEEKQANKQILTLVTDVFQWKGTVTVILKSEVVKRTLTLTFSLLNKVVTCSVKKKEKRDTYLVCCYYWWHSNVWNAFNFAFNFYQYVCS